MDFPLKQWRNQADESDPPPQQQPAKMPKLLLDHQNPSASSSSSASASAAALPLFLPQPNSTTKFSNLSAFPDSSATTRSFPRMGSNYFSLAQWQELELQALIYRYMSAGASVPPELLQPIKKSLVHSPYFLHPPLSHYSYYQPAWYWGRAAMDPEPGRCRRTDGKKWRCSRDVVVGQKYCERHVHRGRNRSRKPVEIPTPASSANPSSVISGGGSSGGGVAGGSAFNGGVSTIAANPPISAVANGAGVSLSSRSSHSIDLFHLNHSCSDSKSESKGLLGPQNEVGAKSDGHVLRHFFDDWPRSSLQEPDRNGGSHASPLSSATCLSISMPGNSSSDVSLKLSTGNGEEPAAAPRGSHERDQTHLNWAAGWGTNQVASMGNPLAEALRSSVSNSSPTSVLHQLQPRGSASETSYVST